MTVSKNAKKLGNTLRPLMFLSQLMGVTFPIGIQMKNFKLVITYRIIVLSAITLTLLKEIPTITFWSRNLRGVHGMLAFIETRLRWFALIVNFLLTSCSNSKINSILTILINSPLILKPREYAKIFMFQIFVLISTSFLIICYNCLGHDILWMNIYYSWYTSTIYIVTEFYIGFSNIQFAVLLYVIKKYYFALNENLKKCDYQIETSGKSENFIFFIAKSYKQSSVNEIVKFRQIHMNLTLACWKTNECFSLQVLLFLVVSLVEIIYSLRAVTLYSLNPENDDTNQWENQPLLQLALICSWAGYYFWSILQLIVTCEGTVLESLKTTAVVHNLINNVKDKDVEKQIFSMQLMNHRTLFTAGKFVTLNLPLVNSIIGTVITYLVLVITFT